jgi:hypothetical protein
LGEVLPLDGGNLTIKKERAAMTKDTEAVKKPSLLCATTFKVVPYVKELHLLPQIKSVNACLLMRQLEYWFERYPDEFYKFLSPPDKPHKAYKKGKSWTEELAFSEEEFRNAFDQIGVRYKSKKLYDAAGSNKFQGRFYCSYTDKLAHMTYYYRYHVAVDSALDWLVNRELYDSDAEFSETELSIPDLENPAMSSSRSGESLSQEMEEYGLDYKEITKENNKENNKENISLSNYMGFENSPFPSNVSVQSGKPVVSSDGRITSLDDLKVDWKLEDEYKECEFDLGQELLFFKDYCRANDRTYADYKSGFRLWLNKKIEHGW